MAKKWKLTIKGAGQKGERPYSRSILYESEQDARRAFGRIYKQIGTNWARVEAWIDPPHGKRIRLLSYKA